MNELEKEIHQRREEYNSINFRTCFENGTQFILDKNIPVLFSKWLVFNYQFSPIDGEPKRKFNSPENIPYRADIDKLHEFWINNIYGKEK